MSTNDEYMMRLTEREWRPLISLRRVGVMWHWRIGRLGGSLYLKRAVRRPPVVASTPNFRSLART